MSSCRFSKTRTLGKENLETNYKRGRRKEYKICKELKKEGFDIVQRTAGSHSPIDIIAINSERMMIWLVQVKPDNLSEKEQWKILNKMPPRGTYLVVTEVR